MLSFFNVIGEGGLMGRRRTGVNKVRDIIRYRQTTNLSERQIARALGVSRTVVAKTILAFQRSGLDPAEVAGMADSQLLKSLQAERAPSPGGRYALLEARFPEMIVELKKRKGMTLQYLWERYISEYPRGYQYSQFCLHFHCWQAAEEVTMHTEYKAGRRCWWTGRGTG
jgi:transposase